MQEAIIQPQETTWKPAGFWVRVFANLIDTVIGIIIYFIIAFLFSLVGITLIRGVDYALSFVYFSYPLYTKWKATPGKLLFGLQVLHISGEKLTPARAYLRYAAFMLNIISLGFTFIVVGVRKDKRGIHDLLAHTMVVYKPMN